MNDTISAIKNIPPEGLNKSLGVLLIFIGTILALRVSYFVYSGVAKFGYLYWRDGYARLRHDPYYEPPEASSVSADQNKSPYDFWFIVYVHVIVSIIAIGGGVYLVAFHSAV